MLLYFVNSVENLGKCRLTILKYCLLKLGLWNDLSHFRQKYLKLYFTIDKFKKIPVLPVEVYQLHTRLVRSKYISYENIKVFSSKSRRVIRRGHSPR